MTIYHLTPCPFCGCEKMPPPPETPHPHAKCPSCGRKSRAAIATDSNGEKHVQYCREHSGRGLVRMVVYLEPYQVEYVGDDRELLRLVVKLGIDNLEKKN